MESFLPYFQQLAEGQSNAENWWSWWSRHATFLEATLPRTQYLWLKHHPLETIYQLLEQHGYRYQTHIYQPLHPLFRRPVSEQSTPTTTYTPEIREAISRLKSYFDHPDLRPQNAEGQSFLFLGNYRTMPSNTTFLADTLGYTVPEPILDFLHLFGGTELFAQPFRDTYRRGIRIYSPASLATINQELQQSTEPFWPTFAMIGDTPTDDLLCVYFDGIIYHFGNLHHEAWAEPEVWASDGIIFAPFGGWLETLLRTNGDSIPDKRYRYDVDNPL